MTAKVIKNLMSWLAVMLMSIIVCVGYATLTDNFVLSGNAQVSPDLPELYISNITPESGTGIKINGASGTVMFATVSGQGTTTFTITITNTSTKTYVYERVVDGAETGIDGIYNGTDIKYEVSNIREFDEVEDLKYL